MDWKIVYCVMGHNNNSECFRSFFRWEAEKWISDKFISAAPHSGVAEFYVREVWTNQVDQEEWD
jgi:hypothetical protein